LPSSLTVFHSIASGFSPCPPASVCSTDQQFHRLAAFLVSRGSLSSELALSSSCLRINDLPDLPRKSPYTLEPESINRHSYLSPPLLRSIVGYRNINLSSIGYAFRPRLRVRLTLGGLTFPRKPWAFGEQVFHLFFATHASMCSCSISSVRHRITFTDLYNAPLPLHLTMKSIASVLHFSPVVSSAQKHLTSELLRFL